MLFAVIVIFGSSPLLCESPLQLHALMHSNLTSEDGQLLKQPFLHLQNFIFAADGLLNFRFICDEPAITIHIPATMFRQEKRWVAHISLFVYANLANTPGNMEMNLQLEEESGAPVC